MCRKQIVHVMSVCQTHKTFEVRWDRCSAEETYLNKRFSRETGHDMSKREYLNCSTWLYLFTVNTWGHWAPYPAGQVSVPVQAIYFHLGRSFNRDQHAVKTSNKAASFGWDRIKGWKMTDVLFSFIVRCLIEMVIDRSINVVRCQATVAVLLLFLLLCSVLCPFWVWSGLCFLISMFL